MSMKNIILYARGSFDWIKLVHFLFYWNSMKSNYFKNDQEKTGPNCFKPASQCEPVLTRTEITGCSIRLQLNYAIEK